MPRHFTKDPDAILPYQVDWSDWMPAGDTLTDSEWEADAGITVDSDTNTTTVTTIWLSGGAVGAVYSLTNHVTTAGGREDDRTITVTIRER